MKENARKLGLITVGALLYTLGLKLFIIPNGLFDNGTTGISVLIYYGFNINLSLVFVVLNMPFWIIGYLKISKPYGLFTILAILLLSGFTALFDLVALQYPVILTKDVLISAIFGGLLLGIGVGVIIKSGGSLDGVETSSILLSRKVGLTIGEIALSINVIIMLVAGIIFGMDKFFYSLISYFVSSKAIDITIEGINTAKNVFVISDRSREIAPLLMSQMNKGVTYIAAEGAYSGKERDVIMLICTRFEVQKVRRLILDIDPKAFVVINDVHEVTGGRVRHRA